MPTNAKRQNSVEEYSSSKGSRRETPRQEPIMRGKVDCTLDPLVSTKLHSFRTRPKLVARPRLTESLTGEVGRRLTLLSAPAGFGKTALLNEWIESRAGGGRSVGWVSLDEGDNDPVRFVSYLVAALTRTAADGGGAGCPRQRARRSVGRGEHNPRLLPSDRHRERPLDRLFSFGSPAVERALRNLQPRRSALTPRPAARARPDGRAAGRRSAFHTRGGGVILERRYGPRPLGR